jgi:hypothetical protein
MDTIAPTIDQAMSQITSLEDLQRLAEQRRHINAIYGPAARKLVADGLATTRDIAEAYGIKPSTAHVLIRDAA